MAKKTQSDVVMVEEVKFNENDKKRLTPKVDKEGKITQKGEHAFGETARIRDNGPDVKPAERFTFYQTRNVGGEATVVEENDLIVTYRDGSQEHMTPEEAKKRGVSAPKTTPAAAKKASKDTHEESLALNATLEERAKAQGNTLGAQSDKEARMDTDIDAGSTGAKEVSKEINE